MQKRDVTKPLLIHPGFAKTGTTFLQSEIFSNPRLFRQLWDHDDVDRFVIRPHDLDFDPAPARAEIARLRSCQTIAPIDVVSSETLNGNLFFGLRENVGLSHRLKEIFEDAKILITVRRQLPIIKSTYMMYLDMGGTHLPEDFFDPKPHYIHFGFDPRMFEFHKIVELYAQLFGRDNVHVLPQEILEQDGNEFLIGIFRFCGVEAQTLDMSAGKKPRRGVGARPSAMHLLRFANRLQGGQVNTRELRPPLAFIGSALARLARSRVWPNRGGAKLDKEIRRRFAGAFANSNARLQTFTPYDLRALGYEMPEAVDVQS